MDGDLRTSRTLTKASVIIFDMQDTGMEEGIFHLCSIVEFNFLSPAKTPTLKLTYPLRICAFFNRCEYVRSSIDAGASSDSHVFIYLGIYRHSEGAAAT